jgi:hypothetical protein
MLGFEFDDNYTPFSLFNIISSLTVFGVQLILSLINGQDEYLYLTIVVGIFGLILCGVTYWFPFREEKALVNDLGSFITGRGNN